MAAEAPAAVRAPHRPAPPRRRRDAPTPLWAAVLLALLGGLLFDGAFPDRGIWPLAFPAVAVLLLALRGRQAGGGFLVGLAFGLAFYLIHIEWATLWLGEIPWLALSTLQALFVAAGGMLITLAYRLVPRAWPTRAGRLVLLPIVVAGLWTLREAISAVWPYGGFSWGRFSMSQSESPFADLVAWLGLSGTSFALVWLTALAVESIAVLIRRRPAFPATVSVRADRMGAALLVAAAAAALVAVPAWRTADAGTLRVAAVQGNTRSAYFDQRDYQGEILDGHITATLPLLDSGADPDVLIWPEGASDLDPLQESRASEALDLVSDAIGAPMIVGAITVRGDDIFNSSILWEAGEGAVDVYDKRHPVPFGEYVPDRSFWEPFAPDLIGLIQREYTPGTTSPVFDVAGTLVGVDICFDIVDDGLITESVQDGAELLIAQSNNADFGRTDESVQQLAIARLRAIETGRSVVNISTVGTSATVAPDGSTLDSLPVYTAGAMVVDVPLRTGLTPATAVGRQLEQLAGGFGLAMLVVGGVLTRRRRV
ncbi:MAG TPA: apolipoprotein N-acyltransferase [Naasia sp.]